VLCRVDFVALHEAEAGPSGCRGDGRKGKALPGLVLLPHLQVVCKAMLAALFAVKSRCSVVSMSWPCMKQRQGLQGVGEMGVKGCVPLCIVCVSRWLFVPPAFTSSHFNAIDVHYNSHSLSSIFRCPPPPPLLVYYPAPRLHDNIHVYCQPFLSRRCVSLSHALVPQHLAHTALSLPTSTPTHLSIAHIHYTIDNTLPCSMLVPLD
jgi:hypothetical protein